MNTYVGIDIAKAELVAHALPQEQQRSFANSAVGLTELLFWLQEIGSTRVVFEATGGYERPLLKVLFEPAWLPSGCRPTGHASWPGHWG